MLPLPALAMVCKRFRFRLRDSWEHTHLDNHLSWKIVGLGLDWTIR